MKKLLAFAIVILGFSAASFGQVSANASAKIVTALVLTHTSGVDLNFGTMTRPTEAVDITVNASTGAASASVPTAITLLSQAPVSSAAAYTVAGAPTSYYDISLPVNGTITMGTIAVKDFTTTYASTNNRGTLDGSGVGAFSVGATITLASGQAAGSYTTTYNVNVNYN